MKKLCVAIAVVVIAMMALTGCGSKSRDSGSAIKGTIDGFFDAVKSGEYAEAVYYTTAEGDVVSILETLYNIGNWKEMILSSVGFDAEDLDKSITEPIDEMIKTIQYNIVDSYEIGEITASEGDASARVTISFGIDPGKLEDIDISGILSNVATNYLEDNFLDTLVRFAAGDEDTITEDMLPGLVNEVTTAISGTLLSTGGRSESFTLELTEYDGKWLISGIDILS